jgi:hypothetical protein
MTWLEIANTLTSGLIGPGIGALLVIILAAWRWYRGVGPMGIRVELAHLATIAIPIAAGALIMGQSWRAVVATLVVSVATAAGWNSNAAIPPLVPAREAPPPRTEDSQP